MWSLLDGRSVCTSRVWICCSSFDYLENTRERECRLIMNMFVLTETEGRAITKGQRERNRENNERKAERR